VVSVGRWKAGKGDYPKTKTSEKKKGKARTERERLLGQGEWGARKKKLLKTGGECGGAFKKKKKSF